MIRADIIFVGAGLSSLSAAQELHRDAVSLVVLEKSRGVGGRASTRRLDGIPIDHGAQFFTARTDQFQHQVRHWQDSGVCFPWSQGFHQSIRGRISSSFDGHTRYACADGMTALGKAMARGLPVERECKIVKVAREDGGFRLVSEDGRSFWGKRVVVSAPVPQFLEFAGHCIGEEAMRGLASARFSPCFSVVVETFSPDPEWRGLNIQDSCLAWVSADFTKRTPRPKARYIVLHSTAGFAVNHFDVERHEIGRLLLEEAARADPSSLQNLEVRDIHRWKFAKVENPLSGSFYEAEGIYLIGDAFGGRIESAWLSGKAVAQRIREDR